MSSAALSATPVAGPIAAITANPRILHLVKADFVASDMRSPPAGGWQPVTLPDPWLTRSTNINPVGWYRLGFHLDKLPATLWVIDITHLGSSLSVELNGAGVSADHPAGTGYSAGDGFNQVAISTSSSDAFYASLPPGRFRLGENTLYIRAAGTPWTSAELNAVDIGERSAFSLSYQFGFVKVAPALYLFTAFLLFGLMVITVDALQSRALTRLTWTIAIALLCAFAFLPLTFPLPRPGVDTAQSTFTAIMFAVISVTGYRLGRCDLSAIGLAACIAVALSALATVSVITLSPMAQGTWWIYLVNLPVGTAVSVLMLRKAWGLRAYRFVWLGLILQLWIACIAAALVYEAEFLPWSRPPMEHAPNLSLVAAIVAVVVISKIAMVSRERQFARNQQALQQERRRIIQDMHDGMGVHLVTALHLSRRDDVSRDLLAQSIESSLSDMRLIIDSLDGAEMDLLPMLANLRFRLEPRLRALGIAVEWHASDDMPSAPLTHTSALSITRIVQEAINNVVKHANASVVTISVDVCAAGGNSGARAIAEAKAISITIRDNGDGFPSSSHETLGRGMRGMQKRATSLGAEFSVESSDAGSSVTLVLPVI